MGDAVDLPGGLNEVAVQRFELIVRKEVDDRRACRYQLHETRLERWLDPTGGRRFFDVVQDGSARRDRIVGRGASGQ